MVFSTFFRGKVLHLWFEEENDEVLDKIFDLLFLEAAIEISHSLFCIKFMKRDVYKCNQIYVLFLEGKSWKIHVRLAKTFIRLNLVSLTTYYKSIHHHH